MLQSLSREGNIVHGLGHVSTCVLTNSKSPCTHFCLWLFFCKRCSARASQSAVARLASRASEKARMIVAREFHTRSKEIGHLYKKIRQRCKGRESGRPSTNRALSESAALYLLSVLSGQPAFHGERTCVDAVEKSTGSLGCAAHFLDFPLVMVGVPRVEGFSRLVASAVFNVVLPSGLFGTFLATMIASPSSPSSGGKYTFESPLHGHDVLAPMVAAA